MVGDKTNRRTFLGATGAASIAGLTGYVGKTDGLSDVTANRDGQETAEWDISGSSEGSSVNTWVQAFSAQVDEYSDQLSLNPQFVNGWRNATVLLDDGEFDASMFYWYYAYEMNRNEGPYAEGGEIGPPNNEIRGTLPTIHQSVSFFCTYADRDDINTVHDLDGKTVATDNPGSGPTMIATTMADVLDLDINFEHIGHADTGNALQSRRVDAAMPIATNGEQLFTPYARAWSSHDMKGVGFDEDVENALQEAIPYLGFTTVRNDELNEPGDFDTVRAFSLTSGLFTTADQDADLVYELVSSVLDYQDELGEYHPALEQFGIGEDRHNFAAAPDDIQMHEGAIRYYEENDIEYPGQ